MAARKQKRSFALVKRDKETKQATVRALLAPQSLSSLALDHHCRRHASALIKELDASLFCDPRHNPEAVAVALIELVNICFKYMPDFVREQADNLKERRKRAKRLVSAGSSFRDALLQLRQLDRLRPEGLTHLLKSPQYRKLLGRKAIMAVEATREFHSRPELKSLELRFGSLETAVAELTEHIERLATLGWIPWVCDQRDYVTNAETEVLRRWAPISLKTFGKHRWDLLSAVLSSKFMRQLGFAIVSRGALKARASDLGIADSDKP
ncbi:MAG: hypothetical protein NDJ90_09615 [Oligoflexia bacterium]|nr:hypothetical protein [Oligoflexia bacterium]